MKKSMGLSENHMASAIYNTLTNAYLGPESDGTCNEELRRLAFDSLAMQASSTTASSA